MLRNHVQRKIYSLLEARDDWIEGNELPSKVHISETEEELIVVEKSNFNENCISFKVLKTKLNTLKYCIMDDTAKYYTSIAKDNIEIIMIPEILSFIVNLKNIGFENIKIVNTDNDLLEFSFSNSKLVLIINGDIGGYFMIINSTNNVQALSDNTPICLDIKFLDVYIDAFNKSFKNLENLGKYCNDKLISVSLYFYVQILLTAMNANLAQILMTAINVDPEQSFEVNILGTENGNLKLELSCNDVKLYLYIKKTLNVHLSVEETFNYSFLIGNCDLTITTIIDYITDYFDFHVNISDSDFNKILVDENNEIPSIDEEEINFFKAAYDQIIVELNDKFKMGKLEKKYKKLAKKIIPHVDYELVEYVEYDPVSQNINFYYETNYSSSDDSSSDDSSPDDLSYDDGKSSSNDSFLDNSSSEFKSVDEYKNNQEINQDLKPELHDLNVITDGMKKIMAKTFLMPMSNFVSKYAKELANNEKLELIIKNLYNLSPEDRVTVLMSYEIFDNNIFK